MSESHDVTDAMGFLLPERLPAGTRMWITREADGFTVHASRRYAESGNFAHMETAVPANEPEAGFREAARTTRDALDWEEAKGKKSTTEEKS